MLTRTENEPPEGCEAALFFVWPFRPGTVRQGIDRGKESPGFQGLWDFWEFFANDYCHPGNPAV